MRRKIATISLVLGLMLTSEILPASSTYVSYADENQANGEVKIIGSVRDEIKIPGANEVFKVNDKEHTLTYEGKKLMDHINWEDSRIYESRGIVIPYDIVPMATATSSGDSNKSIEFSNHRFSVMVLRDSDGDKYPDSAGEIYVMKGGEKDLNELVATKAYQKKYIENYDVDDDDDGIANIYDVNPKKKDKLNIDSVSSIPVYKINKSSDNIIATSNVLSPNDKAGEDAQPVKYSFDEPDRVSEYFEEYELLSENAGDKTVIQLRGKVKAGILKNGEKQRVINLGKLKGVTRRDEKGLTRGQKEDPVEVSIEKDIEVIITDSESTHGNPLNPRIEVKDKNNLTNDEKEKVADGVRKSNPGAKNIKVKEDGSTTFNDEKGNKKYLDQKDTVVERKTTNNNSGKSSGSKNNLHPNKERMEGSTKNTHRVSGTTRYETAVEVSKATFPNGADTVILSNGNKFSDVLTAVPYGKLEHAPILYVDQNRLPVETLNEINRLKAKKVILIGGENTISKDLENKVKNMKLSVSRIGGVDRYETSKLIGENVRKLSTKGNKDVVVASGELFPDALSISPLALKDELPILLVKKNNIPKYTEQALSELSKGKIYVSGGINTISDKVQSDMKKYTSTGISRYAGTDRYDTSVQITKKLYPESKISVFTSGEVFPDALVAGEIVNKFEAPLMLVKKNEVPKSVYDYVKQSKIEKNIVVGGVNTVSNNVLNILEKIEKR